VRCVLDECAEEWHVTLVAISVWNASVAAIGDCKVVAKGVNGDPNEAGEGWRGGVIASDIAGNRSRLVIEMDPNQ